MLVDKISIGFLECRHLGISRRKHRLRDRPLNPDGWIIPQNPLIKFGSVLGRHLIGKICLVAQHTKAMGKAHRDIKHVEILVREDRAYPLTIGGRAFTDIYRYIENLTREGYHQLPLSLGMLLVVQSSKRVSGRVRVIALNEFAWYAVGCELGPLVGLHKKATLILENPRFDQYNVRDVQPLKSKWHYTQPYRAGLAQEYGT